MLCMPEWFDAKDNTVSISDKLAKKRKITDNSSQCVGASPRHKIRSLTTYTYNTTHNTMGRKQATTAAAATATTTTTSATTNKVKPCLALALATLLLLLAWHNSRVLRSHLTLPKVTRRTRESQTRR
ncbi:hypothetical protein KR215_006922 [Drosophila sulfurigaster]|nr:hypothetical protein KR215_006922 [Drosophila sulfurigaster]